MKISKKFIFSKKKVHKTSRLVLLNFNAIFSFSGHFALKKLFLLEFALKKMTASFDRICQMFIVCMLMLLYAKFSVFFFSKKTSVVMFFAFQRA